LHRRLIEYLRDLPYSLPNDRTRNDKIQLVADRLKKISRMIAAVPPMHVTTETELDAAAALPPLGTARPEDQK
jgi:hypothetical protein